MSILSFHSYQNDCEISPGSRPQPSPFTRTSIAPWDDSDTGSLNQHPGHAIGTSSTPSYYTSALSTEQRLWPSAIGGPPSAFAAYLHDLPEERSMSLAMSRTQSIDVGYTGDRRPSVASAETVSSTGSGRSTSRAIHKKLHDFFQGDVSSVPDSRQSSQTSLPTKEQHSRNSAVRNPVNGGLGSRSISPGVSRPRTPHPSSEVTPWLFQDEKVRLCLPKSGNFSERNREHLRNYDYHSCNLTCMPQALLSPSVHSTISKGPYTEAYNILMHKFRILATSAMRLYTKTQQGKSNPDDNL